MTAPWLRSLWPYFAAAQGSSLVPCAMLLFLYADRADQADILAVLLASTLLFLPLALFALAWIIDVYLRFLLGQLRLCLRKARFTMDLRLCLRLPGTGIMKAAAIAQMMYASMITGILLFPLLVKWYS